MARRRFSRIREAPRLANALTRLRAWEDARGTRPRVARPASSRPGGYEKVQIRPFALEGDRLIRVGVSRRARTLMAGDMGTRAAAATPAALPVGAFNPAKIVLFVGTGERDATSEITGLEYQQRVGASYTHPFGGSTATEREFEAFTALSVALIGTDNNRSVSYVPERFYVES